MTDEPPPSEPFRLPSCLPGDDTEVFPGNWVSLFPEQETPGVKNAGGLFCGARSLPIPKDLAVEIEDWAGKYPWRHERGAIRLDPSRQAYDDKGFELARQLSAVLPHWVIEFSSASGAYRTPTDQDTGIVTADGAFLDATDEQEQLRQRLFEEENGVYPSSGRSND